MSTRIYLINVKGEIENHQTKLVEASNPAQAIRHVARELLACKVATTREVADLVAGGIEVEEARAEQEIPA